MSRRILQGALILLAGFSLPALADTSADKAAELRAAIDACDKGASVPLDPQAKAPAVHYGEFLLAVREFDKASIDALKALVAQCKLAAEGAPEEPRLRLEWLRGAYFDNFYINSDQTLEAAEAERRQFALEIRRIAASGSAEANYLLYEIYRNSADPGGLEGSSGISRDEALKGLTAAGAVGHLEALRALLFEYRFGPDLRRDPEAALHTADKIIDLPRQGPEPAGAFAAQAREQARVAFGEIALMTDDLPAEMQGRGFAIVKERFDRKEPDATIPYATALRYGRGTKLDPAGARAVLEAALAANDESARGPLADMLARGEGGAVDGKRALALLQSQQPQQLASSARVVLAGLYLDNRFTGRRPREAIDLLAGVVDDIDAFTHVAGLLVDYPETLTNKQSILGTLAAAAVVGEPGATNALARLKLFGDSDYRDIEGARVLLTKLAADGDTEAAILLAETQYVDLASSSFRPSRRPGGISDAEIGALVRDLTTKKQASAFRLKAELFRAGVIFPQDDEAATKALISAAELGDVTAMVMLGEAYDDGTGIDKDPRERLRWWRQAAKLGSLEARRKLASAFTFDVFDRLVTLREGVTERIALYNNSGTPSGLGGEAMATMDVSGAFTGSRSDEGGTAALAAAVMDAFRLAPAGLDDALLVPLAHVMPDEVRIAVEQVLKQEGFYGGNPKGYFGPDVRKALAAWVEARGPLPDEAEAPTTAAQAPVGVLPADLIGRLRERAFKTVKETKDDKKRDGAIEEINLLARNGDLASRWALVSSYDDVPLLQKFVTPEEMTRYSLDLLVSRPKGAEKIEFEFIFNLSALFTSGRSDLFGAALLDAVRDDPRLQDPLTLGGIFQQVEMAPGACDAVARAAKKSAIPDIGDEGCAEGARTAVIAFAKAKGPAGIDKAAREAAAATLSKLDAPASP